MDMRLLYLAMLLAPAEGALAVERFTSEAGRFSVVLPGKPTLQEIKLDEGDAPPAIQYQHTVNHPSGAIVVWYQDASPGVTAQQADPHLAIKRGKDAILKMARGNVKEDRDSPVDGNPGRYVVSTIPAMNGVVRSQTTFVDGRVYQINVVGTEAFVFSEIADKVFESFALVKRAVAH